jgi:A/G-specific adenine glycosylase
MSAWAGLGYYSRARHLHRCAQQIVAEHGGEFPHDPDVLAELPGVGRSTAAAIAAFAYGVRAPILDGNVKRVLARHFGVEGYPGAKDVERALWSYSEQMLPTAQIESYTQGLMDLGAAVCTRRAPRCTACPLRETCVAYRDGRVLVLPEPRPRRALPERATTMLVFRGQGEVLLEKRPSTGIWGGLWCFPETDDASLLRACARYGVEVEREQPLSAIEHGFTHFRLTIKPVVLSVKRHSRVEEPGRLWLTQEDAFAAAIPVPVKRILLALREMA